MFIYPTTFTPHLRHRCGRCVVPAVIHPPSFSQQRKCTEKFSGGWAFNGVSCGTPGEFPDGADYGMRFEGKAPAYVIGYLPSGVTDRQEL